MRIDISGVKSGSSYESLFKTIGFVVVQWGHCEQSLELLVNTLFLQYEGNKLRKKMPRQLSEKLAFAKESALNIPSLSKFRADIEALVSDFESLTQKRHDLVHGALADPKPENDVFQFIRLETHPDIHEVKSFQYDLKEFAALEAALLRLGKKAPKLATLILRASQAGT